MMICFQRVKMTTTRDNRSAYILMEVIVSIMILSIVGISLLKTDSNEKKLYSVATSKLGFLRYISIPLNHHSMDMHEKELDMYTLIKSSYDLKNDTLIKRLKKIKVHYTQKYKSIINIAQDKNSLNLLIDEITLSNKKGRSRFLTVRQ